MTAGTRDNEHESSGSLNDTTTVLTLPFAVWCYEDIDAVDVKSECTAHLWRRLRCD